MPISKKVISEYLDSAKIRHSNPGFGYLITAISLCLRDADAKHHMIQLYSDVAALHRSTGTRVERAIRHAIQSEGIDLPNGEFIARAVDHFELEES